MYEDYKSAKLDVTNNWSRRSALTQTSLRSKTEEGVLCVCSLKHQPLICQRPNPHRLKSGQVDVQKPTQQLPTKI